MLPIVLDFLTSNDVIIYDMLIACHINMYYCTCMPKLVITYDGIFQLCIVYVYWNCLFALCGVLLNKITLMLLFHVYPVDFIKICRFWNTWWHFINISLYFHAIAFNSGIKLAVGTFIVIHKQYSYLYWQVLIFFLEFSKIYF